MVSVSQDLGAPPLQSKSPVRRSSKKGVRLWLLSCLGVWDGVQGSVHLSALPVLLSGRVHPGAQRQVGQHRWVHPAITREWGQHPLARTQP